MKVIYYVTRNPNDVTKIIKEELNNDNIDGFFIDITMNDNNIKIVNNTSGSNNINDLINLIELTKSSSKNLFLNLIGSDKNKIFVELISDIVNRYPNNNLYISSIDQEILYYLQRLIKYAKIGMVIDKNNLNYFDLDFYIFSTDLLNKDITTQQLKFNKEIGIIFDNPKKNSKNILDNLSGKSKTVKNNKIYLITDNPYLLSQIIK